MKKLFNHEKIIELRHELHRFPELSDNEFKTAERITNFLSNYVNAEIIQGIGGNGIACIFKGKDEGPSVLFRCDLDALPIEEVNEFDYRSTEKGVSHKCGHDGHMAIIAGLAEAFSNKPPEKGQVVLLFQPSEENGQGAQKVINDEKFKKIKVDYVFALHNLPGYKKGSILLKDETFASASKGIIIKLIGKASHAAEPENGISPAIAMSNIVKELTFLPNENKFSDFTLVTVVYSRLGEVAFGTSPGYAEIMATLRTYSNDDMRILTERAEGIASENAFRHNLKLEVSYTEEFPATSNNNKLIEIIKDSALQNKINTEELGKPLRWSEDFAHFTQKFPGVLFGLGCGES
ncbi:amidohydrolase, partial [Bacteroidota bacterium]